jgi:hypothetical protein
MHVEPRTAHRRCDRRGGHPGDSANPLGSVVVTPQLENSRYPPGTGCRCA